MKKFIAALLITMAAVFYAGTELGEYAHEQSCPQAVIGPIEGEIRWDEKKKFEICIYGSWKPIVDSNGQPVSSVDEIYAGFPVDVGSSPIGGIDIELHTDELVITMGDPNDFCKECPTPQGNEIVLCSHGSGIVPNEIDMAKFKANCDSFHRAYQRIRNADFAIESSPQLDRIEETINAIANCLLAMGELQLISSRKISEMHAVICAEPEKNITLRIKDCGLPVPAFHDGYDDPNVCSVGGLCTKHIIGWATAPCRRSERERIDR